MFAEELDKLRLQLKDTQEELHAAERAKEEQSSQKRLALDRAGRLENELAAAREDLKTAGVKLTAAVAAAADAQVLRQNLGVAETELAKTKVALRSVEAALVETRKRNAKLEEDLAVATAHLVQNKARYEEALKLLEAFKRRSEADLVISSGKLDG